MRKLLFLGCLMTMLMVKGQALKKEYIDPHYGYSDAVVVHTPGAKTIYVAGQIGEGNSLEEQMRGAFLHISEKLEKAEANFSDVVRYTVYIKDYKEEDILVFRKVREELFGAIKVFPPNVLIGVTALFKEEILVEISAIAMVANVD